MADYCAKCGIPLRIGNDSDCCSEHGGPTSVQPKSNYGEYVDKRTRPEQTVRGGFVGMIGGFVDMTGWAVGIAFAIGVCLALIWFLISGVRWLWTHPLF